MRREPNPQLCCPLLLHGQWIHILNGKEKYIVGIPSGLNGKPMDALNGKSYQIGIPSGLKEWFHTGMPKLAIDKADRPVAFAMDENSGK